MNQPDILFADEPTGALNSKSSDEIMMLFSEIHKKGTAILLVTHDAKVAARAERVLFMQDGKVVSEITFTEISEGYNTKKQKEFCRKQSDWEFSFL